MNEHSLSTCFAFFHRSQLRRREKEREGERRRGKEREREGRREKEREGERRRGKEREGEGRREKEREGERRRRRRRRPTNSRLTTRDHKGGAGTPLSFWSERGRVCACVPARVWVCLTVTCCTSCLLSCSFVWMFARLGRRSFVAKARGCCEE